MAFNVSDIRSALQLDGYRPSQFQVTIDNPFTGLAALTTPFLVKAASIPARNLGNADVFYFGRATKLGGDANYDDWVVTAYMDEDSQLRDAMEFWSHAINSPLGNVRRDPGLGYKSTATVMQYGKTGDEIVRSYRFNGIWPKSVGAVNLDWSTQNRVAEFQVTFSVDNWEPLNGLAGSLL